GGCRFEGQGAPACDHVAPASPSKSTRAIRKRAGRSRTGTGLRDRSEEARRGVGSTRGPWLRRRRAFGMPREPPVREIRCTPAVHRFPCDARYEVAPYSPKREQDTSRKRSSQNAVEHLQGSASLPESPRMPAQGFAA